MNEFLVFALLYVNRNPECEYFKFRTFERGARDAAIRNGRGFKSSPASFKTISDFYEHLKNLHGDKIETQIGNKKGLKFSQISSSEFTRHLIFYNKEMIDSFTQQEIFIDGTFKARPKIKKVTQLLTIMGKKNGTV